MICEVPKTSLESFFLALLDASIQPNEDVVLLFLPGNGDRAKFCLINSWFHCIKTLLEVLPAMARFTMN